MGLQKIQPHYSGKDARDDGKHAIQKTKKRAMPKDY